MLVGLAIAKFVSPEDYGIWGALNLLLTYAIILQLGTINGVNLELPIAMGEKNHEKAKSIIQTSQTYILGCMFVIFVIGILYLLIFGKSLSPKFFWGVAALIVMISFTFYQDFLTATFRTPLSFKKFSYILSQILQKKHLTHKGIIEIAQIAEQMNARKSRSELIRILREHTLDIER